MASEIKLGQLKLKINSELFTLCTIIDFKLICQDYLENIKIYLCIVP